MVPCRVSGTGAARPPLAGRTASHGVGPPSSHRCACSVFEVTVRLHRYRNGLRVVGPSRVSPLESVPHHGSCGDRPFPARWGSKLRASVTLGLVLSFGDDSSELSSRAVLTGRLATLRWFAGRGCSPLGLLSWGCPKIAPPPTSALRVHSRSRSLASEFFRPSARGCQVPDSFRPCCSSQLRRFSPRNASQVCCTLLPTMGFATFQARSPSHHRARPERFRPDVAIGPWRARPRPLRPRTSPGSLGPPGTRTLARVVCAARPARSASSSRWCRHRCVLPTRRADVLQPTAGKPTANRRTGSDSRRVAFLVTLHPSESFPRRQPYRVTAAPCPLAVRHLRFEPSTRVAACR